MNPKIKECILNTLLNNYDIDEKLKYEEVIKYLDTNTDEICMHILNTAIYRSQDNNEIACLLKDFSFCLDAAYEYVYYLSLQTNMANLQR